jgi:uncharacterized protein YgiM (DUF1202 family)
MKTKMIITLTLIAFTFSCGIMEKFGRKEEPIKGETQQQEVVKPEPVKEEAVSESTHQEVKPTPEPIVPADKMVSVTGSVVNIRSGPGTTNKVIAKVRRGDELEVRGETPSWYNVKLSSGAEGWIYKKLVK